VRRFSFSVYQSQPAVPAPSAFSGRGAGRANMIARFCSKQGETMSAPTVAKVEGDKTVHVGRGYALLKLGSESP
jgi:hypothetical protein